MKRTPEIAIVGAGFGGLAAAIELERAGIDSYVVLERASEVGGVWQANTYPGAACDVPSTIYQFSFALKRNWTRRFGAQAEIRDYLRDVATEHGVRDKIRFNTEVLAANFDEESGRWTLDLDDGDPLEVDVLICATGQLSRPKIPDVPGRTRFRGAQFHSAEWDHSVDLTDKRVVVIGGGASAIQVVPAIADQVKHLTVLQRSPSWVVNKYDWRVPGLQRVLTRTFPALHRLHHNAMWWWFESRYPIVLRRLDPIRRMWMAERRWTIRRTLKDPDKITAATPDYPMGCNRILLSSDWYPTLAREDVSVHATAVAEVTKDAVITADGRPIAADVIIWCTGFTPTEYLTPMRVTGRGGLDIRDAWRDGPEAYLGISTPGFPNMLMSYGPNTGSLTNTIVYLLERQAAYMRQAVEHLAANGGYLDVREDVHRAFNDEVQQRLSRTVFTAGCPGWYTTEAGKVTQVWAGSHIEYGRCTRRFDPSLYDHVAADRRLPAALRQD